jgi:hypothetical protein
MGTKHVEGMGNGFLIQILEFGMGGNGKQHQTVLAPNAHRVTQVTARQAIETKDI